MPVTIYVLNTSTNINCFDYSFHFDNKIKLFLTQSSRYWDSDYPQSRREKIAQAFNINNDTILIPKQVHGDSVLIINNETDELECDAIIYGQKSDIVGTINVADCIPICIYDSDNHNIALVHSGWRGTCKKIILKTINILESLGSNREFLKFFLGPSIRSCCYQVEKSFSEQFSPRAVFIRNKKYFIDLATQIKIDLEEASIPSNNIIIDDLCTYDSVKCHSFRRDGKSSGRMTMIAYRG